MTTSPVAAAGAARPSAVFADTELVIQSHPGASGDGPRFGDTECWELNGVLPRPAKLRASAWRIMFCNGLADPAWNLLARELALIMFNPRHPAVVHAGLSLSPRPTHPTSVINRLSQLRRLARWATRRGLPATLGAWREHDVRRFLQDLREGAEPDPTDVTGPGEPARAPATVATYLSMLALLHHYRPALTGGGLTADPRRAHAFRYAVPDRVSTPTIPPQVWFPLLRAAWAYVHTFGPDVLRARERYTTLRAAAVPKVEGAQSRFEAWLADPTSRIPIHPPPPVHDHGQHPRPNWTALALQLGVHPDRSMTSMFGSGCTAASRRRREAVLAAIGAGTPTQVGYLANLTHVTRADATIGDWHPGLDGLAIRHETFYLRTACFVLVAALSMMRDSEIHEISKDALIEHYGYPAVTATQHKHDPRRPTKAWWITAPVAEAITMAAQLSPHPHRVFAPIAAKESAEALHSGATIDSFIRHVNATRNQTGLDEIPDGRVRPHMFRRTMAMLTDQFAGSEIALGIQLKHVATRALANASTQGYAAGDPSWADHFDTAADAARFRRIEDLYRTHQAGGSIGYGPAAERMAQTFDRVQDTVAARGGDATVERALLRSQRISIRFGSLNHCAFDEANPAGALCLDNTTVPDGHRGPLHERCRPDRCANSIIAPEHLPVWNSEKHTLLRLLDTPGLAPARSAALHRELASVEAVLDTAGQDHP